MKCPEIQRKLVTRTPSPPHNRVRKLQEMSGNAKKTHPTDMALPYTAGPMLCGSDIKTSFGNLNICISVHFMYFLEHFYGIITEHYPHCREGMVLFQKVVLDISCNSLNGFFFFHDTDSLFIVGR